MKIVKRKPCKFAFTCDSQCGFSQYTKESAARSAETKRTEGAEARGGGRNGRSEVDGGERGRAGVLLRGSVVKRIDPNHYDMSRLHSAASTMAGSPTENETPV